MFTEHIRECQQYTEYYLCKKHKCDLKDCIETYLLVVVFFKLHYSYKNGLLSL